MKEEYQEIEKVLNSYIRPRLKGHGGDVTLACIKGKIAYVRLSGHCSGCPSAKYTLESLIKEAILQHTNLIEDVKLQEEVSQGLYDFARELLAKGRSQAKF